MRWFGRPVVAVPTAVVLAAILVLSVTVLSGGSSEPHASVSPAPTASLVDRCGPVVDDVVDQLQAYVAHFDGLSVAEYTALERAPGTIDLQAISDEFRDRSAVAACDPVEAAHELADAVDLVRGEGPIAHAIAVRLRSAVAANDPAEVAADDDPGQHRIAPGDDLAEVVGRSPPGSEIVLDEGTYRLEDSLVLLAGLQFRGQGRDTTRIVGRGADATIVSLTPDVVGFASVTIAHAGPESADVLLMGSGQFRLEDARITGGVRSEDGRGGTGLVAGGAEVMGPVGGQAAASERLVRRTEFVDNEGEGIVAVGPVDVTVEEATFVDNGSCGLCLIGATGKVRSTRFEGNRLGVAVTGNGSLEADDLALVDNRTAGMSFEGAATGELTGTLFEGNGGVGMAVNQQAAPHVRDTVFRGHDQVGLAVAGTTTATVVDSRFEDNAVAMQFADQATPVITAVAVTGSGQASVLAGGDSRATLSGLTIRGGDGVGVQVQESARPTLSDSRIDSVGEVALLYLGSGGGRVEAVAISGTRAAIQLRDDARPDLVGNTLSGFEQPGILYTGRSAGRAVGTDCGDRPAGVVLLEQADPQLDNPRCQSIDLRGA